MDCVWMELRTDDTATGKAFYENTFGWTAVSMVIGSKTYWRFSDGTNYRAGMVEDTTVPTGGSWIGYIWVDEPDSIITAATNNGGTVLMQGSNHPVKGRWAILKDDNDQVFGVYNGAPFDL